MNYLRLLTFILMSLVLNSCAKCIEAPPSTEYTTEAQLYLFVLNNGGTVDRTQQVEAGMMRFFQNSDTEEIEECNCYSPLCFDYGKDKSDCFDLLNGTRSSIGKADQVPPCGVVCNCNPNGKTKFLLGAKTSLKFFKKTTNETIDLLPITYKLKGEEGKLLDFSETVILERFESLGDTLGFTINNPKAGIQFSGNMGDFLDSLCY